MTNLYGDIQDKICVITGGSGVIGKGLALAMAKAGMRVVIVDYKEERCQKNAEELSKEAGKKVTGVLGNVLDRASILEARKKINSDLGKIDFLINCAGGNAPTATTGLEFFKKENLSEIEKSFFGLQIEGFQKVFDLNFTGTLIPTLVFAEDMLEKGGVILNVSSMNSFRPLTKIPAYSAAKAAVNNFTQWLAVHFAQMNIRVNAIAPGFFVTNQNRFLLIDEKTNNLTPRGNKIINNTPMGKFGDPDDLVGTTIYLLSDMSRFVTGVVVPVDGGFSAYSGV